MSHQISTAPDQFFLYAINLFLRQCFNYIPTRLVHDKERLVKLTEPLNDQSRLLSIAELDGTIKGLRAT